MHEPRSKDRRIGKTRALLQGALASLIHEKHFDRIVVKEILGRANVGRSTFYSHFRDKGELLDTGIREMVRASASAGASQSVTPLDQLLRFSLPLLIHIGQFRGEDASVGSEQQAAVHVRLRNVLTELVAHDLKRLVPASNARTAITPIDLLAAFVASNFVLVVTWWMQHDRVRSAADVNAAFRALVTPALAGALPV